MVNANYYFILNMNHFSTFKLIDPSRIKTHQIFYSDKYLGVPFIHFPS